MSARLMVKLLGGRLLGGAGAVKRIANDVKVLP